MRILFAASPDIAIPALEAVFGMAGQGIELAGVLTNPDSPRGRGNVLQPTDIGAAAAALQVPADRVPPIILKPEKLDSAAREQVAALKPDLLVSFAYGHIFGPKFLALFPLGGINIHPSLLPKYRGPTPIPAAILAREKETGITIQKLALEMDTGDILLQEKVPLTGRETCGSLSDVMAAKAAQLLPGLLAKIAAGTVQGQPQNNADASYCKLIAKENGRIDWTKSAGEIDAQIRAYDPSPRSWTMHGGQMLFILQAEAEESAGAESVLAPGQVLGVDKKRGILVQTGKGVLLLTELQYHTKKALAWKDFLNGAPNFSGALLGK